MTLGTQSSLSPHLRELRHPGDDSAMFFFDGLEPNPYPPGRKPVVAFSYAANNCCNGGTRRVRDEKLVTLYAAYETADEISVTDAAVAGIDEQYRDKIEKKPYSIAFMTAHETGQTPRTLEITAKGEGACGALIRAFEKAAPLYGKLASGLITRRPFISKAMVAALKNNLNIL